MAHVEKIADSTIYPSLFGLLSTSLPVLHKMQPRVFRALRHYARLSGADARAALKYESDAPIIRVAELPPKSRLGQRRESRSVEMPVKGKRFSDAAS